MRKIRETYLASFVALIMLINCIAPVFAVEDSVLDDAINNTAEYMYKAVANPQVGSVSGEWAV